MSPSAAWSIDTLPERVEHAPENIPRPFFFFLFWCRNVRSPFSPQSEGAPSCIQKLGQHTAPMVPLPNQNQLFAYYIARCGYHRVGKPSRAVLHLLREDEASRVIRLSTESADRQVSVKDLKAIDCVTAPEDLAALFRTKPLARRRAFRLPTPAGEMLYVGARGMLAILDLVAVLPCLEELDLSNITSWYVDDAFAHQSNSPMGNDVTSRLCDVMASLPALRKVDISTQPIGTLAAHQLFRVIQKCKRIQELRWKRDGVDYKLCDNMQKALARNTACAASLPPVEYPKTVPTCLQDLPILDRKTLREQQILRALLCEDSNFAGVLSEDDLSTLVLNARLMSTQEVVARCGVNGLRGDGANLFVIKSGSILAQMDLAGFTLMRGDYFGDVYDEVVFPACRLVEEVRGIVYSFPLDRCQKVLETWSTRVTTLYHSLRKVPLFQPLDTWTRVRLCSCAQRVEYKSEEVVLAAGEATRGLWIVCEGTFNALSKTDGDQLHTGRYDSYPFTTTDVFGVEPLVSRKGTSSVAIVAGKPTHATYSCAVVKGSILRLLTVRLRAVFVSMTLAYSIHDDLRQTALKAPGNDEFIGRF